MKIIDQKDLQNWLSDHPQWRFEAPEIVYEHNFGSFVAAFGFLAQVAILAETHNHHPTIVNTYGTVRLSMTTHDADNQITDKDLDLAEAIEAVK